MSNRVSFPQGGISKENKWLRTDKIDPQPRRGNKDLQWKWSYDFSGDTLSVGALNPCSTAVKL